MHERILGEFITIDEMMVRYKGTYCPTRQYMPKKPQNWGIKIWTLEDSTSKYVYNFDIYCKQQGEGQARVQGQHGESSLASEVVTKLITGLEFLEHCITMDNYFTSIPLFVELASMGIYATGSVRANCIGIPSHLKNTRIFKRVEQGYMEWAMHEDQLISCVMWKDKCPVLLLSTHATPICAPYEVRDTVQREHCAIRDQVFTSPMLVEYTKHMRGVDVAD